MRVLHVIPDLFSPGTGTSAMGLHLARALRDAGVEISVITLLKEGERASPELGPDIKLLSAPVTFRFWNFSASFGSIVDAEVRTCDVVHVHGLWHYPHWRSSRAARRFGKPCVVSPHGMLSPRALGHRAYRKRLYWRLFEHHRISGAASVHALTQAEREQYRRVVKSGRCFIVPAGIRLDGDAASERPKSRKNGAAKTILFLGRIHPIKGLDLLLPAFARCLKTQPSWELILAGADEGGYAGKISTLVRKLKLEENVKMPGLVGGPQRARLLREADVFVLPSYSEGFSVAVLEAMAEALPVLMTNQCGFPQAARAGAARIVPATEEGLTEGLQQLMGMSDGERYRMGLKGRELVGREYAWPMVARKMIGAYEKIVRRQAGRFARVAENGVHSDAAAKIRLHLNLNGSRR
jgi:glycosyltransferase involved in cell wall biosynthesis